MRKIESEMLAAIHSGRNVSLANTTVTHDPVIGGTEVEVRLHGNLIAKRFLNGAWEVSLAGWNTTTTRSRLSAIAREFSSAYGIGTRKGTPEIRYPVGNERITTTDWHAL